MERLLGPNRRGLATWLSTTWINAGPSVCLIEGFAGVGKTEIAQHLMVSSSLRPAAVWIGNSGADQLDNMLLDLATELSNIGIDDLAHSIQIGASALDAFANIFGKNVLIVLDEFQNALVRPHLGPNRQFAEILRRVSARPYLPGRLLLVSDQKVERGRWSDHIAIRSLPPLEAEVAVTWLEELLEVTGIEEEIRPDRKLDVINWLGRNPRAIRVFVAALEMNSVDELIGLDPQVWELRDREVSPELVQRLEKELLQRTILQLNTDQLTLLRRLSVYRRPVTREAFEFSTAKEMDASAIRDDLVRRFLIERKGRAFVLNPSAREISLQRLKENNNSFRRAHSLAADYYLRHFKAKEIAGSGFLGGYFVEARFHTVQARRERELGDISGQIVYHLKTMYSSSSEIPLEPDALDERIAVLAAVLERTSDEELEHYLARLFVARGTQEDLKHALIHAEAAISPTSPAHFWQLRCRLEREVHSPERALVAYKEAIERIRPEGLAPIYLAYARLMEEIRGKDHAIDLLREAIEKVSLDHGLGQIYIVCAKLLAGRKRVPEAIDLLKAAILVIPPDDGLGKLYLLVGRLLAESRRRPEAIEVLKTALQVVPVGKQHVELYLLAGRLLADGKQRPEAIELLKTAIEVVPADSDLAPLYRLTGRLMGEEGRSIEAIDLLEAGIDAVPRNKGISSLYLLTGKLLAEQGRVPEAIDRLKAGTRVASVDVVLPDIYKLLSELIMRYVSSASAAIAVLEGIERLSMVRLDSQAQVVECFLLVSASARKPSAIERYDQVHGQDWTDSAQSIFSRVLTLEINGEWDRAAELARMGRGRFPHFYPFVAHETLSWLGVNDPVAARASLRLKTPEVSKQWKACIAWLSALVESMTKGELESGVNDLQSHRTSIDQQERLDTTALLEAWASVPESIRDSYLALQLPIMPKVVTRLSVDVTRDEYLRIRSSSSLIELPPKINSRERLSANQGSDRLEANEVINVEATLDLLPYNPAEQPWYPRDLPSVREIDDNSIAAIKDEIDVVIITATEVEKWSVLCLLSPYPRRRGILKSHIDYDTYYLGRFGAYNAAVFTSEMGASGQGGAILATQAAINTWKPKVVIMTGIAMGKERSEQNIGDVIVATQIVPYELQRRGSRYTVYRSPIPPVDATLLNRFRNVENWRFLRPDQGVARVIYGPLLSGEKLIDNRRFKESLFRQFPTAVGAEMEGAGVWAASGRMRSPWIVVKAICDWGENKRGTHQPLAAAAASSLVHFVLSQRTALESMPKPRHVDD